MYMYVCICICIYAYPRCSKSLIKKSVMLRPAMFIRRVRCGRETPSHTGIICVTPSPESTTTPVMRPCA